RAGEPQAVDPRAAERQAAEPAPGAQPIEPKARPAAAADSLRFEQALLAFDEALATAPDDRDAAAGKGLLLQKLKRHAEALAAFDRGLSFAPQDLLLLASKAPCLEAVGRFDDARAPYPPY